MTEILILIYRKTPNWVFTNVYRDGKQLKTVQKFTYSLEVEKGAKLTLEEYDIEQQKTVCTEYNELEGDKIIKIPYTGFKSFLEELRNEDSILLR